MMMRIKHWAARAEEKALGLLESERLEITQGALTLVSDDGEDRNLELANLLGQTGAVASLAVADDFVGRPGFLGYAHLLELQQAGHEIAFHGRTRVPFDLFPDGDALRADLLAGATRLRAQGLSISNLIYRWGTSTRAARKQVQPLFASASVPWFGLNEGTVNRYALRRIAFGAFTGRSVRTQDWFVRVIEQAAQGRCWPILMLHPGAAGHTAEHNAMLHDLLVHAKHVGLPVRTLAQHLAALGVTAPAASEAARGTADQPFSA
ncbi:hypothetical protein [Methylibium sp.]|uniref:hypothetical protein n=1 Tax=Methylibium sp. TaxID=2067992 RepID=UPI003D1515A4